jgi:hypothetical protein
MRLIAGNEECSADLALSTEFCLEAEPCLHEAELRTEFSPQACASD